MVKNARSWSFYFDRIVSRLMGAGDIEGLAEKKRQSLLLMKKKKEVTKD